MRIGSERISMPRITDEDALTDILEKKYDFEFPEGIFARPKLPPVLDPDTKEPVIHESEVYTADGSPSDCEHVSIAYLSENDGGHHFFRQPTGWTELHSDNEVSGMLNFFEDWDEAQREMSLCGYPDMSTFNPDYMLFVNKSDSNSDPEFVPLRRDLPASMSQGGIGVFFPHRNALTILDGTDALRSEKLLSDLRAMLDDFGTWSNNKRYQVVYEQWESIPYDRDQPGRKDHFIRQHATREEALSDLAQIVDTHGMSRKSDTTPHPKGP